MPPTLSINQLPVGVRIIYDDKFPSYSEVTSICGNLKLPRFESASSEKKFSVMPYQLDNEVSTSNVVGQTVTFKERMYSTLSMEEF